MQLPGTQLLSPGMSPQQLAAQRAAGEAQGKAAAALPNTLQSMDLAIGTLDKIINHPAKNDWFASGASALIPPLPGTEARNYVDTVNQFKNQLFEMGAATMRGLGSLSNAEGKKITDAAANIDLRQSPARIAQSMQEAKNVLQAARANAKSVATGSGEYTSPIAPKPETSQQQDTGWTQIAPNIRVRPKQ
jgi:hypothetical protein